MRVRPSPTGTHQCHRATPIGGRMMLTVNLLRAARSCPVTSMPPIVLSRCTSPHLIQRTRGCEADGGELTARGVDRLGRDSARSRPVSGRMYPGDRPISTRYATHTSCSASIGHHPMIRHDPGSSRVVLDITTSWSASAESAQSLGVEPRSGPGACPWSAASAALSPRVPRARTGWYRVAWTRAAAHRQAVSGPRRASLGGAAP